MNKEPKKGKPIGPFSFCPKHNVFYASCKCPVPKTKSVKKVEEEESEE